MQKFHRIIFVYYNSLLHIVLLLMQKLDNTLIVCECCLHVCNTKSLTIHYLIAPLMFNTRLSYHYAKVWSLKPFICFLQESQSSLTYVTHCKLIRRPYIYYFPTYIWMDAHLRVRKPCYNLKLVDEWTHLLTNCNA